jgi:ribosomal protein L10
MRNDIINIEKKIEELMVEKIGILFDNHKKVTKVIDEFKKTYNDNKKDFELRINDIKNNR